MASRAMSLRSSTGSSNRALAAVSSPKSNGASPTLRPRASKARTRPARRRVGVGAGEPRPSSAPGRLSAPTSASGVGGVGGDLRRSRPARRARRSASPPPRSRPSAIHSVSRVGMGGEEARDGGERRRARRRVGDGRQRARVRLSTAAAVGGDDLLRRPAKAAPAPPGGPRAAAGRAASRASAMRRSQLGAAGQPSSSTISSGPLPPAAVERAARAARPSPG